MSQAVHAWTSWTRQGVKNHNFHKKEKTNRLIDLSSFDASKVKP